MLVIVAFHAMHNLSKVSRVLKYKCCRLRNLDMSKEIHPLKEANVAALYSVLQTVLAPLHNKVEALYKLRSKISILKFRLWKIK